MLNIKIQKYLIYCQQKVNQTKIKDMSIATGQKNSYTLNVLMILIFCLIHQSSENLNTREDSTFLVLKNNKIFALGLQINISQQIGIQNEKIIISNDQQVIKVQIILKNNHRPQEKTITSLTQLLPIFSSHLISKGYLKPIDSFTSSKNNEEFIKGYVYKKPVLQNVQDQTFSQVEVFLKTLIQQKNLNYFNLRMQDSFQIHLYITPKITIKSIKIQYLFATVEKDEIPSDIIDTLGNKTQSYDNYLARNSFGTLQRKLSGKGLHQTVNLTIILDDLTDILLQQKRQKCYLQFTDILPESTYIDVDQRRKQIMNFEIINIEKPSFAAKQYFYKYRVKLAELKQSGIRRYLYQQPIHFRYPSPSLLNYTKIYLHPIEKARIICKEDMEKNFMSEEDNEIYVLKQNHLFDRGVARIPNADSSKQKLVSVATLVVCLVSVLIIIKNLKKR